MARFEARVTPPFSRFRMLQITVVYDLFISNVNANGSTPEQGEEDGMPIFGSIPSDFPSIQLAHFTLF